MLLSSDITEDRVDAKKLNSMNQGWKCTLVTASRTRVSGYN
jgi:hypothetical protein